MKLETRSTRSQRGTSATYARQIPRVPLVLASFRSMREAQRSALGAISKECHMPTLLTQMTRSKTCPPYLEHRRVGRRILIKAEPSGAQFTTQNKTPQLN